MLSPSSGSSFLGNERSNCHHYVEVCFDALVQDHYIIHFLLFKIMGVELYLVIKSIARQRTPLVPCYELYTNAGVFL